MAILVGEAHRDKFEIRANLWRWAMSGKSGSWYFLIIKGEVADDIRCAATMGPWLCGKGGFGSVKVQAQIGSTIWNSSLFPHKESGGWLLPVKAEIRRVEDLGEGDQVTFTLLV